MAHLFFLHIGQNQGLVSSNSSVLEKASMQSSRVSLSLILGLDMDSCCVSTELAFSTSISSSLKVMAIVSLICSKISLSGSAVSGEISMQP